MPHLNMGSRFRYPEESEFSTIWCLMMANQLLPWSIITKEISRNKENINAIAPFPSEPSISIYGRNNKKTLEWERPIRACPECLKYRYHTALFELPWLLECPVHHCTLETRCPECQQLWPTLSEYIIRDCVLCGRWPMGNWLLSEKTCKQRLDTNDFERIWKIISSVPTNQLLRNRHYHRLSTKSCSHDLFDFNYAGYIRNHLMNVGNTRDIDFWDGLKTSRPKIYSRTWKLTPTSSIHSTDPTPLHWQELFKTRFKAFKKIVNYCNSNKRNKHRPILGQVDFVLMDDCHVTICPICVALNLWIKHVQIYPYREGITIPRYHYNFLDWLWCYDFFEPEALTHFDTFSSESYLTNKELICWAYERDLLFCFAEILTVIQTIGEDTALWNRQSSISDSVTRKIRELRKRYLSDFIYAKDDDLYIHYAIRSPLDLVDAQPRASISNCRMWRTQIRKTQEVEARDARLRYADSLPTEKRYLDYEIEMQTAYVPDHEKKWFALDMMRWFENYQRLYHEKMALQS